MIEVGVIFGYHIMLLDLISWVVMIVFIWILFMVDSDFLYMLVTALVFWVLGFEYYPEHMPGFIPSPTEVQNSIAAVVSAWWVYYHTAPENRIGIPSILIDAVYWVLSIGVIGILHMFNGMKIVYMLLVVLVLWNIGFNYLPEYMPGFIPSPMEAKASMDRLIISWIQ